MSKLRPTWYYPNLLDIPLIKLKEMGFEVLLCDLDNTLTPAHNPLPTDLSYEFYKLASEAGLVLYVISNNHLERVSLFADKLGVKYHYETRKPFASKMERFILKEGLDKTKCLVIGDQLLTDIAFANKLGIKSILVEPCSSKDLIYTFFNRIIDKKMRKRYKRKRLLKGVD